MAGKSKAPEYQAQEPAFLRKLRQANTGAYGEDGRQLNPVSIARSKRLEKDETDDAPTYVLEEGQTLTRDEAAKMLAGKSDAAGGKDANVNEGPAIEPGKGTQSLSVANTAMSRKRKAAKVIGVDDPEDAPKTDSAEGDSKKLTGGPKASNVGTDKAAAKKKRKAPAMTLSFGDDDAD